VEPLCCEAASLSGPRSRSVAPYRLSLPKAAEVQARSYEMGQECIYVVGRCGIHSRLSRAPLAVLTYILFLLSGVCGIKTNIP